MLESNSKAGSSPSILGILLAVFGSIFIGLSYTASKTAHNLVVRNLKQRSDDETAPLTNDTNVSEITPLMAGDSSIQNPDTTALSLPYDAIEEGDSESLHVPNYSMVNLVKIPIWYLGLTLLLVGEAFNFISYAFAPASVIAPLGTMSIISGAISGFFYLGEKIGVRNICGMLLSTVGASVIVASSKAEEPTLTPDDILKALVQIRFVVYASVVSAAAIVLVLMDNWRAAGQSRPMGDRWVIIRVSLTAIFSGFTVLATKSISSLLSSSYPLLSFGISYLLLAVLISNALLTLYYTNKALASFDSTIVLPAEFAAYTITTVFGSAMLYGDFDKATIYDIMVFILGCVITFAGVYFVTSDDEVVKQIAGGDNSVIMAGAFPVPVTPDFISREAKDRQRRSVSKFTKPRPLTHAYGSTSTPLPASSSGDPSQMKFLFPSLSLLHTSPSSTHKPHNFYLLNGQQSDSKSEVEAESSRVAALKGSIKRLSQTGIESLVSAVELLSNSTRASMTFQHVVNHPHSKLRHVVGETEEVPIDAGEQAGHSIVVITPLDNSQNELEQVIITDSRIGDHCGTDTATVQSFEVVSRRDTADEVSYFVRRLTQDIIAPEGLALDGEEGSSQSSRGSGLFRTAIDRLGTKKSKRPIKKDVISAVDTEAPTNDE